MNVAPLPRKSPISKADRSWMGSPVKPGAMVSKGTYLAVAASSVRSKRYPGKSVADVYTHSDKGLWDGEPEAMEVAVKAAFPDFFKGSSASGNVVKERALIGRVLNEVFCDGQSKHAKVNLRS